MLNHDRSELVKRIIPCLDVKNGQVVKGVQFKNIEVIGDIVERAQHYSQSGADELVFYDITASTDNRHVDVHWIEQVAAAINIPFCVAGGIRSIEVAEAILAAGADKLSINSPALENPGLIEALAHRFGTQCVVVGIDSFADDGSHRVRQYSGDSAKAKATERETMAWIEEVQSRGAGEIVLNCINQDGMRSGYDLPQLSEARTHCKVPLIASGGAGRAEHFAQAFLESRVDGALAASIFHRNVLSIPDLKTHLTAQGLPIRP